MASNYYRNLLSTLSRHIDPKYKKTFVMVGLVVAVLFAIFIFVSKTPEKKKAAPQKMARSLLGGGDKASLAVRQMTAKLQEMERENKELKNKFENLSDKKEQAPVIDMGKIHADIAKQVQEQWAKHAKPVEKKPPEMKAAEAPKTPQEGTRGWEAGLKQPVGSGLKGQGMASAGKRPGPHSPGGPGLPGKVSAPDIRVITASTDSKDRMHFKDEKKKDQGVETFLPAGSIFSGTLITGLDASCGKSSKKDPFPVLLRIKKEAILPNMYRADVRECFLIAAGWGDLGSERAYLRAERLSCIREDGKAIETKLDMYAVGEDGKAGVRGRLVNKTGTLLAKSLMAGFMQGFSQIFGKQPVLQIGTGRAQREAPFQSMLSSDAMQGGAVAGAGSALERLSKYYMDMAKDIFPVIEIDAGRAIDFVMISGKSLKLQVQKEAAG